MSSLHLESDRELAGLRADVVTGTIATSTAVDGDLARGLGSIAGQIVSIS